MKILIMQTIAPLQNRHHQAITSVIVSLLLISTVQPSLAQEGDTADRALEEIIVSARRYEESLQDAPVAVNVMTADYLEAQGINKVSDVIEFSPGTTFIRFNKLQDEYSMRGSSSQTEGT
ncbi:MAG: TonB-dependent receptor plug domain-containing protein, partial [Proteobacteria bacterium]|nr:TonB-dependent receptor plug domain-containing protein [Pseudomonadota bacterium]